MRSFASDNNSGVHPLIMDAVIKANDNHAVGYGDDPWTAQATAKIKEVFGENHQHQDEQRPADRAFRKADGRCTPLLRFSCLTEQVPIR